jgi:outer membrane receptor protein involved in Fe transport
MLSFILPVLAMTKQALLFITLFLCLLFEKGLAQSAQISGMVTDSSNKQLPLVTVRLAKASETAVVLQTTLTKENGAYVLTAVSPGTYTIWFSHLGYAAGSQHITVNNSPVQAVIQVLQKTSTQLNEVVVKQQRPLVEQTDDKIVFNVEDDPGSKSETAIEILRKTPFVSVDGEDNIKVNGQSNFRVLLNNRETSMFANNIKEALRAFPGALIQKIEVITNPSAKYDGEGVGGLINIITKKKIVGYNGTISSFSRTSDKLNDLSINGNAKFGNVGVSLLYDFGGTDPISLSNIVTNTPVNAAAFSKRTLAGNRRNEQGWQFGNAEISWEIDTLNTVSLYANVDSYNEKNIFEQVITTDFTNAASTTGAYNLLSKTNTPGYSAGTDYIRRFKKNKDREFSVKFFSEFGKSESEANSLQAYSNAERYLQNNSYAKNNQFTLQADHSIPLGKTGKFESGVKAILRRASSDFESLVKYDVNDKFQPNPSNTDRFSYSQDVVSIYSMYSFKIKKFGFRAGARVEYTSVDGNFTSSNTRVKNHYTTWLPNFQVSNKMSKTTTLTINYTKRLARPYIWDLNPFVFNNDSLNISFGNPDLGPQTSHNLSAQVRYGKGSTFYGINIEGSYSDNKILDYISYDPATGITKTTSLNIGKEITGSLNLNLNTKLTSKWSLFINGSLRYIDIKNNSNAAQANSGWGGNVNFNQRYQFSPRLSVSNYIGLWQDPVTIQTTYPFNTWYNLAVNYKLFKEKFTISVRGVNFFEKDRDFKNIVRDPNFYSTNINTRIRRGLVLALTYNFGKLTENVSKKKGVTNDDLLKKQAETTGN